VLYVVHCVDAEGPLHESVEATFERLNAMFGLDLVPSGGLLAQLQRGEHDLGSPELIAAVARTFAPAHLATKRDWASIDAMLDGLDSPTLRMAVADSRGGGWHVNWHCVGHSGFDAARNPRRRDLGAHSVFDHYVSRYGAAGERDSIHWHFHPVPFSRQANHSATSYFNSTILFELVSRRVLERSWFPCVNRPGFHVERPDSHWFLEQWLPYDIANIGTDNDGCESDRLAGRWHDWRRAPKDWVIYHPDHDDYQRPGTCRRAIARCLNLNGRYAAITQAEVDKAFAAAARRDVVMAFTNHDFRDLVADIGDMHAMLRNATQRFPHVEWEYADAAFAMRRALGHGDHPHARFDLALSRLPSGAHRLDVRLDRAPFGPQPWLAIATRDGRALHDNLAWGTGPRHWFYVFDEESVPIDRIALVGVATNTPNGRTTVTTLEPTTGMCRDTFHN
jgi:hypothetical protein